MFYIIIVKHSLSHLIKFNKFKKFYLMKTHFTLRLFKNFSLQSNSYFTIAMKSHGFQAHQIQAVILQ